KVYNNEPTIPLPKTAIISALVKLRLLYCLKIIFFTNKVIVQNMKIMAKDDDNADILLIHTATFSGEAKEVNNAPNSMKKGAPGGCPTSNLCAAVMYSPQSHKLTVASAVATKTIVAIMNAIQPK